MLDDEAPMRKALGRLLRANGFGVESFSGGDEFLAAAAKHPPNCLLLDLQMPGRGGFDVLSILAKWPDAPPAIVITAFDEPGACERARGLGAVAYLLKPLDEETLLSAVRAAIEGREATRPASALAGGIDGDLTRGEST